MNKERRLVYSTATGDLRKQKPPPAPCAAVDGTVRIRRETKGRKGKGVITISGLPLQEAELKALAKELKQKCGTGGSVKEGVIEIQGDQREVVKAELERKGYRVKLAGG